MRKRDFTLLRRCLPALLVTFVLLSCSDSTDSEPGAAGTWQLQTVNGQALPFTLETGVGFKLELTGESMTLLETGSVSMMTMFRVTDAGVVSTESIPDSGSYTVNGSTITFTFSSDGSTPQATVTGDTMTLGDIGLTFVYRRE